MHDLHGELQQELLSELFTLLDFLYLLSIGYGYWWMDTFEFKMKAMYCLHN